MDRLKDKIAVVTGATSGIGEAVARMYVKEGAKVVCIGRNKEKGAALVQELEAAGGEAIFVPADLRVKADIENIKAKALERFGRVDILFNAAGVLVHKPFLEHTDEDFDLITETNCRAYIWMMQAFIPVMLEQGKGNIINVDLRDLARAERVLLRRHEGRDRDPVEERREGVLAPGHPRELHPARPDQYEHDPR